MPPIPGQRRVSRTTGTGQPVTGLFLEGVVRFRRDRNRNGQAQSSIGVTRGSTRLLQFSRISCRSPVAIGLGCDTWKFASIVSDLGAAIRPGFQTRRKTMNRNIPFPGRLPFILSIIVTLISLAATPLHADQASDEKDSPGSQGDHAEGLLRVRHRRRLQAHSLAGPRRAGRGAAQGRSWITTTSCERTSNRVRVFPERNERDGAAHDADGDHLARELGADRQAARPSTRRLADPRQVASDDEARRWPCRERPSIGWMPAFTPPNAPAPKR